MKQNPYRRLRNILLITLVCVFSILLAGGWVVFKNAAPRPAAMVSQSGQTIVSQQDLISGQAVYEKADLMDYGSYLGDGSYLGPDYTADALHQYIQGMYEYYAQQAGSSTFAALSAGQQAEIKAKVIANDIKPNRYNEQTKQLTLTDAQVYGLNYLQKYEQKLFSSPNPQGMPGDMGKQINAGGSSDYISGNKNHITQMTDFFFWGAWLSSTNRPHLDYSYTNNWPYDTEAGNTMPPGIIIWSALSVALLVAGVAGAVWFQRRYKLDMDASYTEDNLPKIDADKPITSSQRKTAKYMLVVMLLFLVQIGVGELLAHYMVDTSFYGFDIQNFLPFNLAKTWHLQLVIFWVATAWLATGIYAAPRILGKEPKKQGLLVDLLFYALLIVVAGSMFGEYASNHGWKLTNHHWWLFGTSGWTYVELGRFWQILLIIGMILWVVILLRGFVPAIKKWRTQRKENGKTAPTDRSRLTLLLLIAACAIPAFYVAALFILPNSQVTIADYWRWWIIHLWVEGIFESFAVVLIGWLMVNMKLTTSRSTIRALYFQLILLLGSGVVGIGHHYYWQGDDGIWIALGAMFSALEVVPLCLLIWEAWGHYRIYQKSGTEFPYKGTFFFLAATGIWNTIGAGMLGFLINAPAINYFEHGTQWTNAHAHGSMAGVYGMFSVAILLYTVRNVTRKEFWTPFIEKCVKWAAWLTNIGLAGMIVITLLPVGALQLNAALKYGYWYARDTAWYSTDHLAHTLLWWRIVPDSVFTVGVLLLLYVVARGFLFHLKPAENELMEKALEDEDWREITGPDMRQAAEDAKSVDATSAAA